MKRRCLMVFAVWVISLFPTLSHGAVFLDEDRSLLFTLRGYSQGRMLTVEQERFRAEYYPVPEGTLLQHRTYLEPQLRQDLAPRTDATPFLSGLRDYLGIDNIRYFFGVRVEYEGIYDYGPEDYEDNLPESTRGDLRYKSRLFEAYGDLRFLKRLNLRIGKQNISWGETDAFRLLDQINHLDQSFGGFLTPLDERRVPSFMVKGNLDLGSYGWLNNLALEGFMEPIPELTGGPTIPIGAPWSIITGPPSSLEIRMPKKETWTDARGGGRFLATLGDYSMSLANYWTYPDSPTPTLYFDKTRFDPVKRAVPGATDALDESYPKGVPYLELAYPRVMVSGASLSGPLPLSPYTIFRTEFAYVKDHPVFVPGKSIPLLVPILNMGENQIDNYVAQLDALQRQKAILGQGIEGVFTKRDVIRWAVGLDRNQWIRFLNPRQTFFLSAQFFGEHYKDLPDDAYYSIQERALVRNVALPDGSTTVLAKPFFVKLPQNYYRATATVKTGYPLWKGFINPEFSAIMEFGDFDIFSYLLQPALNYLWDPIRIRVEYNYIAGDYIGIGFLKDRDNVMLKLEVVL